MIQTLVGLGVSMAAPNLMKRLKDQKVQVLHAMPGRVRLQSNHWKEDKIAAALEECFSQLPIINNVQASGITGSLLLEFTTPHLTSEQFDEIVQLAVRTSIDTYPHIKSKMKTSMKQGVDSLDDFVKKQTSGKVDAETLLALWLLFKGTTGFSANPAFASSLLYWAYTLISRDGDRS
ncbi:hypothetical protein LCL89_02260 [Halobacillus yeomjeoni]|uniref:Uncharacterized protein n=1 Tax=Halobacillus yeomjeoni TaxID=311194 RepID=A0A931HU33_9BACI|nr:hypothetical protein [Halobacillus yeomjeoni]MBH0229760.1 hypothetical protein [Halobacillus yeomjeoni]MCA0982863.1 hypothetical protein [Halobacillus yeomjeoni]